MKNLKNKKIFLPIFGLILVSAPIVTLVSCGNFNFQKEDEVKPEHMVDLFEKHGNTKMTALNYDFLQKDELNSIAENHFYSKYLGKYYKDKPNFTISHNARERHFIIKNLVSKIKISYDFKVDAKLLQKILITKNNLGKVIIDKNVQENQKQEAIINSFLVQNNFLHYRDYFNFDFIDGDILKVEAKSNEEILKNGYKPTFFLGSVALKYETEINLKLVSLSSVITQVRFTKEDGFNNDFIFDNTDEISYYDYFKDFLETKYPEIKDHIMLKKIKDGIFKVIPMFHTKFNHEEIEVDFGIKPKKFEEKTFLEILKKDYEYVLDAKNYFQFKYKENRLFWKEFPQSQNSIFEPLKNFSYKIQNVFFIEGTQTDFLVISTNKEVWSFDIFNKKWTLKNQVINSEGHNWNGDKNFITQKVAKDKWALFKWTAINDGVSDWKWKRYSNFYFEIYKEEKLISSHRMVSGDVANSNQNPAIIFLKENRFLFFMNKFEGFGGNKHIFSLFEIQTNNMSPINKSRLLLNLSSPLKILNFNFVVNNKLTLVNENNDSFHLKIENESIIAENIKSIKIPVFKKIKKDYFIDENNNLKKLNHQNLSNPQLIKSNVKDFILDKDNNLTWVISLDGSTFDTKKSNSFKSTLMNEVITAASSKYILAINLFDRFNLKWKIYEISIEDNGHKNLIEVKQNLTMKEKHDFINNEIWKEDSIKSDFEFSSTTISIFDKILQKEVLIFKHHDSIFPVWKNQELIGVWTEYGQYYEIKAVS